MGYRVMLPFELSGDERWLDKNRRIYRFSFKLAAYEAGIGVFGKCGLIVTPEF